METSNEAMVKRLAEIERRMATACDRAWRKKESVKLVAVSKMFPAEAVDEARKAGLQLFGESRIQEAAEKIDQCGSAEWHFVGHLQRNKAKTAVSLFSMIHAVDTVPLLEALAACMKETGRRPALLLEVNVAGDGAKFGFPPALVPGALRRAAALHIPVAGFMTMTPMITAEATRQYYHRLCALRDRWQDDFSTSFPELSMGMSHDFEVAIEEGATLIRIGTGIFGKRPSLRKKQDASGEQESTPSE